eukprot:1118268-Pyramimonas_sp.AAC.1
MSAYAKRLQTTANPRATHLFIGVCLGVLRASSQRANWRRMLRADDDHEFLSATERGMPPWWLDREGNKRPSYRTKKESGIKIAIDFNGNDILDESGNPQVWLGLAGPQGKLHGLDYEYDEYYYED